MKIKIKDIKSNPFRKLESYPLNESKVKSLINSIKETGFWDNIVVREKTEGKFQAAYGHHRLEAVRRSLGEEAVVDIPVKELDDAMMIRIMANENDQDYDTSPAVINETVRVAKEYLEKNPDVKERNFRLGGKVKSKTKAAVAISAFLGGNWSVSRVEDALKSLKAIETGKLDKKAIDLLPHQKAARTLTRIVNRAQKKYGKTVPSAVQQNIACDIADGQIKSKDIEKRILISINEYFPDEAKQVLLDDYIAGEFSANISLLKNKLKQVNEYLKSTRLGESHEFDSYSHFVREAVDIVAPKVKALVDELQELTKQEKTITLDLAKKGNHYELAK